MVPRYLLQSDAANGTYLRTKVTAQQVLAESDALKDLGTTIRANGRDAHLRHDLLQALIHRLDVVRLRCCIILLNLSTFHQVIKDGKDHVRTQRRGPVAQQQCRVHRLANLAALHNQGCLHTLAYANQMMMHGRDGKQRGDESPRSPPFGPRGGYISFIGQDDVVVAIVNSFLGILTKFVQSIPQVFTRLQPIRLPSLGEGLGVGQCQFNRLKPLILYIT